MALSLISQLAHVELTPPKPQESLDFWTGVIGLEETTREGQSVYLRGWGDSSHHTLKLTDWAVASPAPRVIVPPAAANRYDQQALGWGNTTSRTTWRGELGQLRNVI